MSTERAAIIGRTITNVLQGPAVTYKAESGRVIDVCDYYLQLKDENRLLKVGVWRDGDPLEFVHRETIETLESIVLGSPTIVGDSISRVFVFGTDDSIEVYLVSGRMMWVELEEGGPFLEVDEPLIFRKRRDYWTNEPFSL